MFLILNGNNVLDIVDTAEVQVSGILVSKNSNEFFYVGENLIAEEVFDIPEWVKIDSTMDIRYEDGVFSCPRCIYINQMEVRRRFGAEDKIKIDNYESVIDADATIDDQEKEVRKRTMKTVMKDFESSNEFWSDDTDFILAMNILNQYGFLSDERKNELLCIY